MFGEYVKELRIKKNLTLREFCRQLSEDASNWSKIEREKIRPPRDKEKLNKIAKVLGIAENSDESNRLFDFANTDSGKIPDYVMNNKELMKALPVFFRTVGSTKPSTDELKELIKNIKERY